MIASLRNLMLQRTIVLICFGLLMACFYFAGEALQARGKNYLRPVDAALANEGGVAAEAIALEDVLDGLQQVSPVNIVLLDTAREARRDFAKPLAAIEPRRRMAIA